MNVDESGADVRARSAKECAQADRSKGSCPTPQSSSWGPDGADAEPHRAPLSWLTGRAS